MKVSRRHLVNNSIARYELMLGGEIDPPIREQIQKLIAEAKRELAALQGIWSWTYPDLAVPAPVGAKAEDLLDKIAELQNSDFASLQLWDETTHSLRLLAHFNFDPGTTERFATVKDGDGTVCEAAQVSRTPIFVEDIDRTDDFVSLRDWCRSMGIRAIQTTPIFGANGKFIGAFSTHFAGPQPFTGAASETNLIYANIFGRLFADLRA